MSDSETSDQNKGPATKKPISEERLKQLAAAREKAMAKKKLLREITEKEKQIKKDKLNQRLAKVKEYESSKQSQQLCEPTKKKPPSETTSDESSDYESSDDEVHVMPPPPPPPKLKRVAKKHNVSQLTAAIAKEELRKKIERENFISAYQSIFPGSRFI